ncbi:MAG: hypothetical protein O7E51_12205 [Acidobacteria bacterium]|nr:hypothetical protein [Acidobacteriota bacterium]
MPVLPADCNTPEEHTPSKTEVLTKRGLAAEQPGQGTALVPCPAIVTGRPLCPANPGVSSPRGQNAIYVFALP